MLFPKLNCFSVVRLHFMELCIYSHWYCLFTTWSIMLYCS